MATKLLSVRAAQQRILKRIRVVETEEVPLDQCAGRILAQDVLATDLPAFNNSSVDGFAVIAADLVRATRRSPRTLRVVYDIPAGSEARSALRPGQAARIMTGALIPPSADAVLMVEDTDIDARGANSPLPRQVRAFKPIAVGENIRRRGMDTRRGRKVLLAGRRLRPQDLGALAALSIGRVLVYRRPRIALLSSGSELVPLGKRLPAGKIRDSNSPTLEALITMAGCRVIALGIVADKAGAIEERFSAAVAQRVDMIVSSAGVSVGAFDLIRHVVIAKGRLDFWRVNVRPGKPLAVGSYRGIPLIGLPGNPVSAFVGFELFVRPALAALSGLGRIDRRVVRAKLLDRVDSDGRESYLRAIAVQRDGNYWVKLTGHQGSGNLLSLVDANALLIVPAGVKSLAVGDPADVWLL